MLYLSELFKGLRAYSLSGGIRGYEAGVFIFKLLETPHQAVVFGVRYLRVVTDIVEAVVAVYLTPEKFNFIFGGFFNGVFRHTIPLA